MKQNKILALIIVVVGLFLVWGTPVLGAVTDGDQQVVISSGYGRCIESIPNMAFATPETVTCPTTYGRAGYVTSGCRSKMVTDYATSWTDLKPGFTVNNLRHTISRTSDIACIDADTMDWSLTVYYYSEQTTTTLPDDTTTTSVVTSITTTTTDTEPPIEESLDMMKILVSGLVVGASVFVYRRD